MRYTTLLTLLLFACGSSASAQETAPEEVSNPAPARAAVPLVDLEAARALSESFLAALDLEGGVVEAFGLLAPHWPIPAEDLDTITVDTSTQRDDMASDLGTRLDYRLAKTELVADSLVRLSYLERFQDYGLRWIFVFYRSERAWLVYSVSWDDQIELLFESRS